MRSRLIVGFVLFSLVVIVLLEIPLGITLATNARTTAIAALQSESSSLGLVVGAALERGNTTEARDVATRWARAEHGVVLVAGAGTRSIAVGVGATEEITDVAIAGILRLARLGRAAGEEGSHDPDDDYLYAALPIELRAGTVGTVPHHELRRDFEVTLVVAVSAGPLHTRIDHYWISLAAFGAAMLAIAAGVGVLLARSLLRGLASVESAVTEFGAGRFSKRAPTSQGPLELRTLAVTVNQMADRLEELLRTQRAFVADASHQLRTPMTALRLRLENLEGVIGDGQRAELESAIGETDRLSRVVDGLLELARTDGTRPARECVEVGLIVSERIDAWSALAEERGVSLVDLIEVNGTATRSTVRAIACPGHLEQVLDNLLSNALDVTPAGGTVSLGALCADGDVEIRVADNGPGMCSEDRERAFDRFWRHEGVQHEGTGLGLAIVDQLVRASGGSTWLDESPNGGVEAVVRLRVC